MNTILIKIEKVLQRDIFGDGTPCLLKSSLLQIDTSMKLWYGII